MAKILWVVMALCACGDKSKQYVEIDKTYGQAVRTVAAWAPLLERSGGPFDEALALQARAELYKIDARRADDAMPDALLLSTAISGLKIYCGPVFGDMVKTARKDCAGGVAEVKHAAVELMDRAQRAGVTLTFEPDDAVKQKVDALLSATTPGPKAKAWQSIKNDANADPKALDTACQEAADEWKPRLEKIHLDDRNANLGYADCFAAIGGHSIEILQELCDKMPSTCKDPRSCETVLHAAEHVDQMPKRYQAMVKAAAERCRR
jgi:hypothetical protein